MDFFLLNKSFDIRYNTYAIFIYKDLSVNFISMSPKLASSTPFGDQHEKMHQDKRINTDALNKWIKNYDYQLKFVINGPSDEEEILSILSKLDKYHHENIYLMPLIAEFRKQGIWFQWKNRLKLKKLLGNSLLINS